MKRIHIFILCSSFSLLAAAQDFTPLRIDSSYSFFRSLDFIGNPIEVASFEGYSYDEEDVLLQIRRENERSNFMYLDAEEVEVVEVFSNGIWENNKRITTTFANDQPVQIITELYLDGFWENNQRVTIEYYDNEKILTQLTEFWENNEWQNKELIENTYDVLGNRYLQSYSNADAAGNFMFTFGDSIQFNDNNQPTEILSLNGNGNGGIFFSDKFTFSYNNDQLQDTVIYCFYNFPDTTNCQNLSRSIFTYDQVANRVIRDIESWSNNEWVSSGRIEEYAGRNIYSGLPDSIITYDYSLSTIDQIITRQYFEYIDLNEEEVRYEESLFLYQFDLGQFVLENYRENYYQRKALVNNNDLVKIDDLTFFPNPVGENKPLFVKNLTTESYTVEACIYNAIGQLLKIETIGSTQSILAPEAPGIYFIQLRTQEKNMGIQKVIVQ